MLTAEDYAKVLLAVVIFREARGDGPVAEQAVAHVVLNRVAAYGQIGPLANKVIKAITSKNQFSSISIVGDTQTAIWPQPADSCFGVAEAAYVGSSPDPTNGAIFYANEANVTSKWYTDNIINNPEHPVLAVIGKQTFRK